ncbi:MAG: glutamate--tRNA ligase [Syntrophales bacterium]|nr:glutamate--tRNA ligase [Syntrophales bacterium]MCK9528492.1 glutamate--tRNA ligase [Syntrophales bacterium]MDX9923029.1 glutamate--tRNA ligase [Syntrophales bacterium]
MSTDDSSMRGDVRVRFAPSPTGYLHVGGLRTALFNYLFARRNKGTFILRIEDTDQKRSIPGAVEKLISTLRAVGIDYDEGPDAGGACGPYVQSERIDLYRDHAEQLIESDMAYRCFCDENRLEELRRHQKKLKQPTMYDGYCRDLSPDDGAKKLDAGTPFVIRLKFPREGRTVFDDVVRRRVAVDNILVDDQILIKSDGFPTYHLANVVDDHFMGITHVIRGEEWLSSVPKHIFMYKAFGWDVPTLVHLPLLLNPDRSKLSKRQGDVAVESYLDRGYLPEALINFISLLGWHPSDDQEIFSLEELTAAFSLERINKAGAVFDVDKLNWMNGWYIRNSDISVIAERSRPFFEAAGFDVSNRDTFVKVVTVARDYVSFLEEIVDRGRMFYEDLVFTDEQLELLGREQSRRIFASLADALGGQPEWTRDDSDAFIRKSMGELGLKGKQFFFPLRLALFGNTHGPDIPTLIDILGPVETIRRVRRAMETG